MPPISTLLGSRALAENEAAEDEDGGGPHRADGGIRRAGGPPGGAPRSGARGDQARRGGRRRLRWRPGEVRAALRSSRGAAAEAARRRALVTLPLPALKRRPGEPGAVPIDPPPPGWAGGAGHAPHGSGAPHRARVRRTLVGARTARTDPSFVRGAAEPIPGVVERVCLRGCRCSPVGRGARAPRRWPAGARTRSCAPRSTPSASIFGRDPAELRSRLRLAYFHDWVADPLAGGAYSYGGVGAIEARAALVQPVAARCSWQAKRWLSGAATPPCTARWPAAGRPRRRCWVAAGLSRSAPSRPPTAPAAAREMRGRRHRGGKAPGAHRARTTDSRGSRW